MARVHRIDVGALAPPIRHPDGRLTAEARIARTGVQVYRNADGSPRREYRSPAEVFRADSRESFRGVPVTNGHPPTMLSAQNAKQYAVGTVLESPRKDGDYLVTAISVFDAATVAEMEAGKTQVSNGYDVDLVETPGIDPATGQHYDAIQTNIVGNHLAIVDSARAGREAAVRMDAAYEDAELNAAARKELEGGQFAAPESRKLPIHDEAHVRAAMSRFSQTQFASAEERTRAYHKILAAAHKFGIDTKGFEQAHSNTDDEDRFRGDSMDKDEQIRALKLQLEQAQKASTERTDSLDKITGERDTAQAEVKTLKERVGALEAQISAGAKVMETEAIALHSKRADQAEAQLNDLKSSREAEVRQAAELRIKAQAVMGDKFRVDGMADRAIRAVVIKKFAPQEDVGDKVSDATLRGRFDSLVEAWEANARSIARVGAVLTSSPAPQQNRYDSKEARAKAWREQALNPEAFQAAFGLNQKA